MIKRISCIALMLISSAAVAKDRGGAHSTLPYAPNALMRSIAESGKVVDMTGETNGRHENITQTVCGKDPAGNPVTITGVYKYNGLHYEYRLDRRTVTVTPGCK